MPARKARLGRPGRKVYKALQDQPGLHHSSALSARPARVLSHARLHVVRMKSLSLHFVGQKEPLQTISLRTLFHAGSIRTPPAALWSRSARSSRDAHALRQLLSSTFCRLEFRGLSNIKLNTFLRYTTKMSD